MSGRLSAFPIRVPILLLLRSDIGFWHCFYIHEYCLIFVFLWFRYSLFLDYNLQIYFPLVFFFTFIWVIFSHVLSSSVYALSFGVNFTRVLFYMDLNLWWYCPCLVFAILILVELYSSMISVIFLVYESCVIDLLFLWLLLFSVDLGWSEEKARHWTWILRRSSICSASKRQVQPFTSLVHLFTKWLELRCHRPNLKY